jgi:hypothetical protein
VKPMNGNGLLCSTWVKNLSYPGNNVITQSTLQDIDLRKMENF